MTTLFPGDVLVNRIKLHYYRTGGHNPPLLLAHGITDNGLCWTRLAHVLAENYDVIMFDARGHGLSEPNPPDFSIESHAADLAGLIETLELERPVIIGHSMGAANTAFAAATYPDLARAIILEDPPWFAKDSAEERASTIETWRAEFVERKSQPVQAILAAGQEEHPRWTAVNWEPWAESKLQVNPHVVEWMRSEKLLTGWRELLPKITCPILVITGNPQLGALVTPEVAQEVSALSNNVEVAPLGEVGHCIRWENFEEYVSVIGTFFRRIQV